MFCIVFLATLLFWFISCVRLGISAASSEGWRKSLMASLAATVFLGGFVLLAYVEA